MIFLKLDIRIQTIILILIVVRAAALSAAVCALPVLPPTPLFCANEIISWFKLFFIA